MKDGGFRHRQKSSELKSGSQFTEFKEKATANYEIKRTPEVTLRSNHHWRPAPLISALAVKRGSVVVRSYDDASLMVPAACDAAYMSNAKWQKFFRVLIASGIEVERAEWWLLGETRSFFHCFPLASDIGEVGFLDGKFPPFEYRRIERVYIPELFRPDPMKGFTKHQGTSQIFQLLEMAGKFPLEFSAEGLNIVAYSRFRVDG